MDIQDTMAAASPRVSVVMPTYNGEAYVEAAARSILQQTFDDFELIIIDDGSSDGTWAILGRLAAEDARIRLVRNTVNQGISRARNQGTELARGEYIAVMDADDISLPERLAEQVAYLNAHPDVGVVGGAIQILRGDTLGLVRSFPLTPGLIAWTMCFDIPTWHPASMIRRSVLEDVGGYDPDYQVSHDHELWTRLGRQTNLANLSDVVLHYRIHKDNITFRGSERLADETSTIVQRAIERELGVQLTQTEVLGLLYGDRSKTVKRADMVRLLRRLGQHFRDKYHLTDDEWAEVRQSMARRILKELRTKPSATGAAAAIVHAMRVAPGYTVRQLSRYLWLVLRGRSIQRPARL